MFTHNQQGNVVCSLVVGLGTRTKLKIKLRPIFGLGSTWTLMKKCQFCGSSITLPVFSTYLNRIGLGEIHYYQSQRGRFDLHRFISYLIPYRVDSWKQLMSDVTMIQSSSILCTSVARRLFSTTKRPRPIFVVSLFGCSIRIDASSDIYV